MKNELLSHVITQTGFHQRFDPHPLGPLTEAPEAGRWFLVSGRPMVVLNKFEPIPGIPFNPKHALMFPKGCHYIMLPNQVFKNGVIRAHCCRPAEPQRRRPRTGSEQAEHDEDYAVRFTLENQFNEVLASLRYGPRNSVQISQDGSASSYIPCGISWVPYCNNFFSFTVDLNRLSWHIYFKNAHGEETISQSMVIPESIQAEISHMRMINNKNLAASYALEIGIGRANTQNEVEILYV